MGVHDTVAELLRRIRGLGYEHFDLAPEVIHISPLNLSEEVLSQIAEIKASENRSNPGQLTGYYIQYLIERILRHNNHVEGRFNQLEEFYNDYLRRELQDNDLDVNESLNRYYDQSIPNEDLTTEPLVVYYTTSTCTKRSSKRKTLKIKGLYHKLKNKFSVAAELKKSLESINISSILEREYVISWKHIRGRIDLYDGSTIIEVKCSVSNSKFITDIAQTLIYAAFLRSNNKTAETIFIVHVCRNTLIKIDLKNWDHKKLLQLLSEQEEASGIRAKSNNERNRKILSESTLENWYKLDIKGQYSFILLARKLKSCKEIQHLQDIGIDVSANLQTLEKAKSEYFNLRSPPKRNIKTPDSESKCPENPHPNSENKNESDDHSSNEADAKKRAKTSNRSSIFNYPERAKDLCLYSLLKRQEIQSELLEVKNELELMTRFFSDLQQENLQKTTDIDLCKENIRILNEQVSDLKVGLKHIQDDLHLMKQKLSGRILNVENQLREQKAADNRSPTVPKKSIPSQKREGMIKSQGEKDFQKFIRFQFGLIIKKLDQGFASRNQERHGRRISM
jgi:CRISPR/Cas system-associated exonuclease Cas4 (RecB family)